ncbi:MAG: GIY-YIG nuclease family protein [bacterium]|nr:GIY-YIG nuclease family protein [bacterium]
MYFVYILQSQKNQSYYIGSTKNPEQRLVEHNNGKTKSLRSILPMFLLFKQGFETRVEAVRVEKKLKKWKNRELIERIIKEGVFKSTGPIVQR